MLEVSKYFLFTPKKKVNEMLAYREYSIEGNVEIEDVLSFLLKPALDSYDTNELFSFQIMYNIASLLTRIMVLKYRRNCYLFINILIEDIINNNSISKDKKQYAIIKLLVMTTKKKYRDAFASDPKLYFEKIINREKFKCDFLVIKGQLIEEISSLNNQYSARRQIKNYFEDPSYVLEEEFNTTVNFYHDVLSRNPDIHNKIIVQEFMDFIENINKYDIVSPENIEKMNFIFLDSLVFEKSIHVYRFFARFLKFKPIANFDILYNNINAFNAFHKLIYEKKLWDMLNEKSYFHTNERV